MPITMDGVPFMTSATKRTIQPSLPEPYSARNTPAPMPIGSPMRHANPTMIPVPTIAWATPPPVWPIGTGVWVKKFQSSDVAPL